MKNKGFTLIEMLVVIAIIAVLAALALYSATKYINKGKDSAIKGNLVVLIAKGEVWYDKNYSTYAGFCESEAVVNAFSQISAGELDKHCKVNDTGTAWAACAKQFEYPDTAYCVDSKGSTKEINVTNCTENTVSCSF